MTISERLKYVRKMRGFTQESLAAAIGASRGVITNIEYGKVEPQPLVIRAICETLHINEQWLINGKGAMETLNDEYEAIRLKGEIIKHLQTANLNIQQLKDIKVIINALSNVNEE